MSTDRYWLIIPVDRSKPRIVARPYYPKLKPGEYACRLTVNIPNPPAHLPEASDVQVTLPEHTPAVCIDAEFREVTA